MKKLLTFNEHVSTMSKKDPDKKTKKDIIKSLCSVVEFEVIYKSGIFKREKKQTLSVWYTPNKITIIEPDPTKEGKFLDPKFPVDVPFKVGDNPDEAFEWAKDNNFEIIRIKKRGKNKQLSMKSRLL